MASVNVNGAGVVGGEGFVTATSLVNGVGCLLLLPYWCQWATRACCWWQWEWCCYQWWWC